MEFIISFLAFVIPIIFKKYLKIVQIVAAIVWMIAIIRIPHRYPEGSHYIDSLSSWALIILPTWLIGSFVALSSKPQEETKWL